MKEIIIWFSILLLMIFSAYWLQKNGFKLSETSSQKAEVMQLGEKNINVEIVKSPEDLAKGLSGRDSLPVEQGMLFVMSKNSVPSFWMKDMKFPLDIIWINDNQVIEVSKNVSAPSGGTSAQDLPRYRPTKPIDYVLEVNEGFADKNGIKDGTAVVLPTQLQ